MSLLSRVLNHNTDKGSRLLTPVSLNSSRRLSRRPRVALRINLESPPVVLYGQPSESTGSIILGVLTLEVLSPSGESHSEGNSLSPQVSNASASGSAAPSEVMMDSVVLLLVQTMHYTKPFIIQLTHVSGCDHCTTRTNTLARWDALLEPVLFDIGSHAYPFSHLVPGLLAATTKLGGAQSHSYIKYDLVAVAKSASGETSLIVPVNILRLVLRGPDRNSQRVFPPTDVTATAVLPSVMYPKSTFPVELRMDNVVNTKGDRRWRMRKLSWKLEEHTYVRAYACSAHQTRLHAAEELQRKAQLYKSLKLGLANDNASRNASLHHLTVQTLTYYGPPPSTLSRVDQIVAAATASSRRGSTHGRTHRSASSGSVSAATPVSVSASVSASGTGSPAPGNLDTVIEEEPAPTNRPMDEEVHFDEDFGRTAPTSRLRLVSTDAAAPPSGLSVGLSQSTLNTGNRTRGNSVNNSSPSAGLPALNLAPVPNQLFIDELRIVAHGDVKSGWKSDFSGKGRIELVADIVGLGCSTGLRPHVSSKSSSDASHDDVPGMLNEATISCDIDDPELGVYVSHVLVVEVIVAEEVVQMPKRGDGLTPVTSVSSASSGSGTLGVPTGAARVLRMQFKVNVTERSGLGIAWDAEVPPTYDDVRALSPPTYENLSTTTPLMASMGLPLRPSPAVLYGLGDTPFFGSFRTIDSSIDQVAEAEESIQELRL